MALTAHLPPLTYLMPLFYPRTCPFGWPRHAKSVRWAEKTVHCGRLDATQIQQRRM